jgi:hypothetical protein
LRDRWSRSAEAADMYKGLERGNLLEKIIWYELTMKRMKLKLETVWTLDA